MSAATVDAVPAKGKKKLLIIIAVALLAAGGASMLLLTKKEPHDDEEVGAAPSGQQMAGRRSPGAMPVFVPLDAFTVNLADRDAERYAQVGITLEVPDAKVAEQIKAYMPAIRNNILMAISDRTAGELMGREGKGRLAERVKRETSRALGYDVDDDDEDEAEEDNRAAPDTRQRRKKRRAYQPLPVHGVHFSNFIIQ